MTKFRFPDVFLGMLLAVAIFLMGAIFGSSRYEPNHAADATTPHVTATDDPEPFSIDWLTRDGTVFFTFVLGIIAAIQAALFVWQLRYMRKSMVDTGLLAAATERSTRAAIAIELPIIGAEPEGYSWGQRRIGTDPLIDSFGIHDIVFFNLGRTKAMPIEIRLGHSVGNKLPRGPVYPFSKVFTVGMVIETERFLKPIHEFEFDVPPGTLAGIKAGTSRLWFYCSLIYEDFMRTQHEAGFCWEWVYRTRGSVFQPDPTPAYNQKT
jgi:hypothetical protein